MIDPTPSIGFVAAPVAIGAAPSVSAVPALAAADASEAKAQKESAPRRDPISLSVDRDATGVFVYTLTDSSSGRILAVIPRSAVVTSAQQSEVDIQA